MEQDHPQHLYPVPLLHTLSLALVHAFVHRRHSHWMERTHQGTDAGGKPLSSNPLEDTVPWGLGRSLGGPRRTWPHTPVDVGLAAELSLQGRCRDGSSQVPDIWWKGHGAGPAMAEILARLLGRPEKGQVELPPPGTGRQLPGALWHANHRPWVTPPRWPGAALGPLALLMQGTPCPHLPARGSQ